MAGQNTNKPLTMADLMAGYSHKSLLLSRGQEIEGEILLITDHEVVLELGTKSEGVLNRHELTEDQLKNLQIGSSLKVFVIIPENQSGQTIVSLQPDSGRIAQKNPALAGKWRKIMSSYDNKSVLTGKVNEVNKGGLMVTVEGLRGFIPGSQIGLEVLRGTTKLEDLVGRNVSLIVLEADTENNRLVFSARLPVKDEARENLAKFKVGDETAGQVAAVTPFGIFLDLTGTEGVIFPQEISWEPFYFDSAQGKEVDLLADFKIGQEINAKVVGKDEALGRINLSLRQLTEDPLEGKLANLEIDDVVTGMVVAIGQNGVEVKLADETEGFLPNNKIEPGNEYSAGQTTNFLVDNIDKRNRRINLAPFLTSTKGLIYK